MTPIRKQYDTQVEGGNATPGKANDENVLPKFGDYISVEQHRYGCDNEFYIHKVIGTMKSNKWMDVPAITHNGMTLHDHMEDVVACICCGVCEEEVIRYRVSDVKITKQQFPICLPVQPEGKEGEKYTNHFIEWRDRFFDKEIKVLEYKSKKYESRYTSAELEKKYTKAMKESPLITNKG